MAKGQRKKDPADMDQGGGSRNGLGGRSLLEKATRSELKGSLEAQQAELYRAAERLASPDWMILFCGACSAGKSSVVCSLWGDSELLPTAVRDCTQTNTLVRIPGNGEAAPAIRLRYARQERVLGWAMEGQGIRRLTAFLDQHSMGVLSSLDGQPVAVRLRRILAAVRDLFRTQPRLGVLYEPLTDELQAAEEMLAFLDSPEYQPGILLDGGWEERWRHLMGLRLPDGRLKETGRLQVLEEVEVIRACPAWSFSGCPVPSLLDSPAVPDFFDKRRTELILDRSRDADAIVLVALPGPVKFPPWLERAISHRPALAAQTVIFFNQVDTADPLALEAPDGLAARFKGAVGALAERGFLAENFFLGCARLPFLRGLPPQAFARRGLAGLEAFLRKLGGRAEGESLFSRRLRAACDPDDAGIASLRRHLTGMVQEGRIRSWRAGEFQAALAGLSSALPFPLYQSWRDWATG